ncbi:hypothetical protein ULMS_26520 [Patiriisocius marinistellae]|uniref:Uncharacterized protein n=1 Tax=Patiriisocius marinistellae TaxID=2494560 RepID=A0A5J4G0S9_9FLAO|nr:hypothetical protein [Patiriisocius marinistellae]GEQ87144.1 hypothetical protein ULMS_26520 [Patiriisocius marinistellae]
MKKTIILGVLVSLAFIQCDSKADKFAIGEGSLGAVTSETTVKQLDSIFTNDSIVALTPIKDAIGTQGEVELYEKGGKKLLLLSPDDENNPEATITNIRIFDERFKTDKGLSIKSTFKDVKDNYEIAGIQTSFDAVVLFLKDSDVYITIDKKELPENLRYDPSLTIETSQIPDSAKFKYFMIGWDGNEE